MNSSIILQDPIIKNGKQYGYVAIEQKAAAYYVNVYLTNICIIDLCIETKKAVDYFHALHLMTIAKNKYTEKRD